MTTPEIIAHHKVQPPLRLICLHRQGADTSAHADLETHAVVIHIRGYWLTALGLSVIIHHPGIETGGKTAAPNRMKGIGTANIDKMTQAGLVQIFVTVVRKLLPEKCLATSRDLHLTRPQGGHQQPQ